MSTLIQKVNWLKFVLSTDRRIEMKNELLITYKITEYGHDPDRDGDHGETISYTVSDTLIYASNGLERL